MASTEHLPVPPLDLDPESPWLHEAEAIAASTRHYAELSNQTGLAFRAAQQEAFEEYLAIESRKTRSAHLG